MTKVWHFQPYSLEKNLGQAYNEYMALIPAGDSACFTDGDSMHLVSNWGHIIHEAANSFPNAVLTCWINRIHPLATNQLYTALNSARSEDVKTCILAARDLTQEEPTSTPVSGSVSGTLLVVPKHIWLKHPFTESNHYRPGEKNMLGVDNKFTNDIRSAGIKVMRMNNLLIYHQYRLISNGLDKSHLL